MRCEFPEVTRCCFCFPLRLGLLVWAYIKLVSSVCLFIVMLIITVEDSSRQTDKSFLFAFHIPVMGVLFVDIIFHIIFIISAHKKDHKNMRIFYGYSIFGLVMYVLGFVVTVVMLCMDYFIFLAILVGLFQLGIFMWIIVIQIYVLILVRSEIKKLKMNTNFEFVNHAADANTVRVDLKNVEELEY